MRKEKQMFEKASGWLEKNYDNTDFDKLAEEYRELSKLYKGSILWQKLLLDVLDHLEAKANYERRKANEGIAQ